MPIIPARKPQSEASRARFAVSIVVGSPLFKAMTKACDLAATSLLMSRSARPLRSSSMLGRFVGIGSINVLMSSSISSSPVGVPRLSESFYVVEPAAKFNATAPALLA